MAGRAILFLNLAVLAASTMELQQVFILGRHNIRAPLSDNLQITTLTLKWPEWSVPAKYLTEKGASVEEKMGEFFSRWLKDEGLISGGCPNEDDVYIYSNNKQRTIATAKAFTRAAFRNCNVSTHYQNNDQMDLVFAPIIRNTTDAFREDLTKHMQEKINNLHLNDAYKVLQRIIDIENADICKQKLLCDFTTRDVVVYEIGEEPNVKGPLEIGNAIVDFFLMSYYDGVPEENIAWGNITQKEECEKILQITRENQNVRFNHTYLSKEISRPMLKFIRDSMLKSPAPKFTMLVGHDSNQNSVMAALNFDSYSLPGQLELTPIGGKIVFQKWRDADSNFHLKIDYVYYTMEQLRFGTDLEMPKHVTLQLKDCKLSEDGISCPWSDFEKVLNNLL